MWGLDDLAGHHGWTGQTIVHPLGLAILVVLAVMMLVVRRQYAVLPMLVLACFVASAQRLAIGSLDFDFLRIMVVIGWCRVLIHGETKEFAWRPIDYALILWAFSGTLIYTLHYGTTEAMINRLGWSFDSIGMYFLFRMLVRDWKDVQTIILSMGVIALPVLAFFLVEYSTSRNPFAIFGGVPQITNERFGRLRCQGPFSHPIMAGSFWAALVPLIAVQWWYSVERRVLAFAGVVSAIAVVFLCASSGPVAALIFGGGGAVAYLFRHRMQVLRWVAVIGIIFLHVVMAQPVWHLITRVNIVGGSTGWHRFMLYDQFIRRFDEWWLMGVVSTRGWGRGLQDVTSQYVLEGVRGGALTLVCFLVVIVLSYRDVGKLLRLKENAGTKYQSYLAWALGTSLFIHTVSFISISYFGQIIMIWFLLLAMIASITSRSERSGRPGSIAKKNRASRFGRPRPMLASPCADVRSGGGAHE